MQRRVELRRTRPPKRRESLRDATARKALERDADRKPSSLPRSAFPARRRAGITVEEAQLQIIFRETALAQERCAACGYEGIFMEAHHAVAKAHLSTYFPHGACRLKGQPEWRPVNRGETYHDEFEFRSLVQLRWDARNALLLCGDPTPNRCHARHTSRQRPVPYDRLLVANLDFARELGLGWVLERDYARAVA